MATNSKDDRSPSDAQAHRESSTPLDDSTADLRPDRGSEPPRKAPGTAKPDLPPAAEELAFDPFLDQAFLEARRSGSPIVLYFEADWCAPCKEMHATTFRAPEVLAAATGVRFFRVDLTNPSSYNDLVRNSFQVRGSPTVIVFSSDGKESGRRFGFVSPDDFAAMLRQAVVVAEKA